jgi:hypothetical protein
MSGSEDQADGAEDRESEKYKDCVVSKSVLFIASFNTPFMVVEPPSQVIFFCCVYISHTFTQEVKKYQQMAKLAW